MQTVDWIALGVIVVAALIGLILGFGKCLKFFTSGIVGFIISLVVVYFFLGIVASWPFVQELMGKLHDTMVSADNGFVDFLIKIGIEKIILAIALFLIVQILRIIIVSLIKNIVEMNNMVMRSINKFFGMVFMLAVVVMVTLIVFHIVAWVDGESSRHFREYLTGVFRLDWVYDHNPLIYIFKSIGSASL